MKKDSVIRFIIMIVSLAVASYLALQLTPMQKEITPEKETLTKSPVAGLHKFLADVAWMRFINFAGGQSTIDRTNVDKVSKLLKTIISYDPNFIDSYQCGVLTISHADPKLAIKLLTEACSNKYLSHEPQIPFIAGYLLSQRIVDQNAPDKVLSEPDFAAATRFFRMAIKRSQKPDGYLFSNYIRAKAMQRKNKEYSHAVLAVLYDEWKAQKKLKDEFYADEYCRIPNIETRMVNAAREAQHPIDYDGKPVKPSKEALELIAKVQKDVFAANHLCPKCISATHPGDKFCAQCGSKVPVWGVCSCGAVLKQGARFCHKCGKEQ